jgi:hypothetical protein
MGILDKAVELEKALLKRLAARAGGPRHPLETCRAVLDEIEDRVEPTGRGARAFPYTHVAVTLLARTGRERATLEAVLAEPPGLEERVRERLRSRGCRDPIDVTVAVKIVERAPADWEARGFAIDYRRRAGARKADQVQAPPTIRLTVLAGKSSKRVHVCTGDRITIGRMREVLDKDRRVVRQNQIAFEDSSDEVNASVSREHAHIRWLKSAGEWRLYDDNSTHGTRVVRAGRTIAVPGGGGRGVRLRPGDEILVGEARLRVDSKDPDA